ncbi:MAG: adenylate/guanylate cyclase domain-containing protein, partial [Proteobacteria bacterium]|nr:adenylate/guanylate cyclase domain-containing protein [Pseudomonadota bacterium]
MPADPVQRRLAAILAADVAGYSRLMGEDEEGTLATLTAHLKELIEPCIAEHRGRVVKTTGDGLLAEFASVVDAVKCAVAFQEGMAERNTDTPEDRRIVFRIGVNLGDVIVQDGDVYGDGVNVAARLEGLAEPGSVVISGTVHEHVRAKLDFDFDDLGFQDVKNIAEPVHAYSIGMAKAVTSIEDPEPSTSLPLPDKPSIAVLPFDNLSGDPEQEYFADGISEDIITTLSRSHWFFVIARNSSFSFKGTSFDVRQVAQELGVRYVLEGSVRKVGNRVRITAQLIDATTGNHVWANRYDRELDDIFAIQDEITEAIAGEVGPSFVAAEAKRAARKAPENLDAWDFAMRGNWHLWRSSREDFAEAKLLFRKAIALDPDSSNAQAGLALACQLEAGAGWADDLAESREEGFRAAQRAVALDDQNAWAHVALAWV